MGAIPGLSPTSAFRESVFTRSAAPQPRPPPLTKPPTYAAHSLPHSVSKSLPKPTLANGFYLGEDGEPNRVLLFMARHAVLPQREYRNELYARETNSSPHREVILLDSKANRNVLDSIMGKIGPRAIMVNHYKDELNGLGEAFEGDDAAIAGAREKFKDKWKSRWGP